MRNLPALLALCAAACGTGLVDHAGFSPLEGGGACEAPLRRCAGACVAESATACGAQCATCSLPNAQAACVQGACDYECNAPYLRCASGCCTASAVAAGADHACALLAGGARCWGANDQQQLGSAAPGPFSALPVDVPGLSGASGLAAGGAHTCAIVSGGVKCWGAGAAVADVPGVSGAILLAVGGRHACATTADAVLCWGLNDFGQLGDGSAAAGHAEAEAVSGLGRAAGLALGLEHSCALVTGPAVQCWGRGDSGQLGNNAFASQPAPVPVSLTGASFLGSGEKHVCAVVGLGGPLSCWGANGQHQIDASGQDQPKPRSLSGGLKAKAVAGGGGFTCAIDTAGGLSCLGANESGQLAVPGVAGLKEFALGTAHGCAIFADDGVKCWGRNDKGQLGTGATSAFSAQPLSVSGR